MREAARILLIEDDEGDAFLVRELLIEVAPEIDIVTVRTLAEAEGVAAQADCALLDLGLPDTMGLDGLVRLRRAAPDTPVLVLTGHNDTARGIEAAASGAHDYLVKGRVDGETLSRSIRYAIARGRAERSERALLERSCRPRRTPAWNAGCCPRRSCATRSCA
jgi:DNA-binding response OmpR family regulator